MQLVAVVMLLSDQLFHVMLIFLHCQGAVWLTALHADLFQITLLNVQVLKLLERLEVQMIMDVKRKIQKEVTLTLAERARDESSYLPTDLWKHVVGRCLLKP